jgi:hypothetical protein
MGYTTKLYTIILNSISNKSLPVLRSRIIVMRLRKKILMRLWLLPYEIASQLFENKQVKLSVGALNFVWVKWLLMWIGKVKLLQFVTFLVIHLYSSLSLEPELHHVTAAAPTKWCGLRLRLRNTGLGEELVSFYLIYFYFILGRYSYGRVLVRYRHKASTGVLGLF